MKTLSSCTVMPSVPFLYLFWVSLCLMLLSGMLRCHNATHHNGLHWNTQLKRNLAYKHPISHSFMLSVPFYCFSECHYSLCQYAACCNTLMTLSIVILSIMGFIETFSLSETQHKNTQYLVLLFWVSLFILILRVVQLIVAILNVVAPYFSLIMGLDTFPIPVKVLSKIGMALDNFR